MISNLFMLAIYSTLVVVSMKQFLLWRFRPILHLGIGMSLMAISSIFDLFVRYSQETPIYLVDMFLRLSGVCFYLAAFLVIRSLLESQSDTPWNRLIIYAFFYGAMCLLYLLPRYVWVAFDMTTGLWVVLSDSVYFPILNTMTALPAIEIIVLILRRLRRVNLRSSAIHSFRLFGLGCIIASLGTGIIYLFPNAVGMTLSNISLSIAMGLVVYSFARTPLFLSLSSSVLYRIILSSNDDPSLPIACVDWLDRSMTTPEMTSAALHGASILLNEITATDEINEKISRIKLGKREVVIERTNHFTGYLVAENPDKVSLIALRRITNIYEERYAFSGGVSANFPISHGEFVSDVFRVFSFSYKYPTSNLS